MTLKDFILEKRKEALLWTGSDEMSLGPDKLEALLPQLKQCEEFKDCDIEIMKFPARNRFKGVDKSIDSQTYAHHEGVKFRKKVYLYMIGLTPAMFDAEDVLYSGKDGNCITPIMYNPGNYTPQRKIVLSWSPEKIQDLSLNMYGVLRGREMLHDLLDKILDNPREYEAKGSRGIYIRGYFEHYSSPPNPKPVKI